MKSWRVVSVSRFSGRFARADGPGSAGNARPALPASAVSKHVGAHARAGTSVLHRAGPSRRRVEFADVSESSAGRDFLGDRKCERRRCGEYLASYSPCERHSHSRIHRTGEAVLVSAPSHEELSRARIHRRGSAAPSSEAPSARQRLYRPAARPRRKNSSYVRTAGPAFPRPN